MWLLFLPLTSKINSNIRPYILQGNERVHKMSLKMITEILKELKENLPGDVQENYKNIFIAKNVTAILESHGLLFKSESGGRLPTQKGCDLGISTELRSKLDTGEEYFQVLYNETAADCVRNILIEEYPNIDPVALDGYTATTLVAVPGAGRKTVRSIIKDCNVEIALVKHQEKYWTYDESALKLSSILGMNPHKNNNGRCGVTINCEDFITFVIPLLKKNSIDFAINDSSLSIYKKSITAPTTMPEPIVIVGSVVMLQDTLGEITNVYLAKSELFVLSSITHTVGPNDTTEIIKVPITEKEGYQILHPGTPLFDNVFGKKKGEIFTYDGITYTVVSIENNSVF